MPLTLSEALTLLQSGQQVSLRYITANTSKGAGGKVIELAKCKIARQKPVPGPRQPATTKPINPPSGDGGKDPRHHFHFTRNIELPSKQIRTVYPILITHINQQSVL